MLVCDWLHSIGQNHFYVMLPFVQEYHFFFQSLRFRNVLLKVQRRFCAVSKLEKIGSQASVRMAQSCVRMPINVYCSSLHSSGHLNNMSGYSSKFQKNPALKYICSNDVAIPLGRQSVFNK
jgi:hypothetical protein